jgi:calcineurin-like phosphoesterase
MATAKKEVGYLALGTKTWDKCEQVKVIDTWKTIIKIAKVVSKITGKEVRVSSSAGYSNQGTYIYER